MKVLPSSNHFHAVPADRLYNSPRRMLRVVNRNQLLLAADACLLPAETIANPTPPKSNKVVVEIVATTTTPKADKLVVVETKAPITSTTTNSPTTSKKKKVRFSRFRPKVRTCPYEYQESDELWYNFTDFQLFKRDIKRRLNEMESDDSLFQQLQVKCQTAQGMKGVRTADSAALCDTDYRGLEQIKYNKQEARNEILEAIILYYYDEEKNPTDEELAQFARQKSLPGRRLARVLGTGDTHVVRGKDAAKLAR